MELGMLVSWGAREMNQVTGITRSQAHSGGILEQHSKMLAGTQALQGTKSHLEIGKGHPTLLGMGRGIIYCWSHIVYVPG